MTALFYFVVLQCCHQVKSSSTATQLATSTSEATTAISAVNTDKFASTLRESGAASSSAASAVVGRDVSVVGDHHRRQSSARLAQQQQQQVRSLADPTLLTATQIFILIHFIFVFYCLAQQSIKML